ncbi:MAG: ABC transporter ATP-binding protein [Eubacteriales bacterium]|nr:ABC transporter ATP-binding protein [Eubacteriales bacterium]MDD4323471.1 ABC transporter ATP-binding protein [Eubacteriales bacterium]MDD4541485.1 ABC transporter ATP-binding protein [Eubacteriales bacterium]
MLKSYVKPHISKIIVNAIVKMSGTVLEVVLPTILAYIINQVVPTRQVNSIINWGLVMVACALGAWYLNVKANRMASKTAAMTIKDIRHDLFTRSLGLSARQIDRLTVSSLESRLTSDTYAIHRFLGATLRMGIRSSMLFLGGVVFCFILSWRLALVLLVLIPPLLVVVRYILKRGIPLYRQVQVRVDDMVQVIRENIRGIKVSKALDTTEYEKDRYAVANRDVKDAEVAAAYRMSALSPLVNIILYSGLAVVLILGANLVNVGLVQTGTILAFMSYFIQITNSLLGLNRMFNIYNRASASASRISEVLEMPLDINQKQDETYLRALPDPHPSVPEVEFRNVSFSYLGKKLNLEDVSFKLYPGDTLGIMGATGSGKSTIIRLLLRQYDVNSGEILLRGVNIKNLHSEELLSLFGSVFQNDFLYSGTARENIAFGRDLTEEEIIEATKHAQAYDFLNKKHGLDFILASKGVNLSGGQKQRLLLSRALAGDPTILLLDDSSSALDFRTEANLRQAIRANFSNATSIVITQRVSSVRAAREIIFLDEGRVIAQGTHEELLQNCQPYREIAEMQTREGGGSLDYDMSYA